MFVNTVPTARTRTGDFSDFRDTNGNLIPIFDPLTTRLNPAFNASRPVSATNPQFLRDPFLGNIIPAGPDPPDRPERRQHLSAAERRWEFQQLHVDGQPRVTDNVFSGRVDHRASREGFVLRPIQLGQVQARCAAGAGGLLSADAG